MGQQRITEALIALADQLVARKLQQVTEGIVDDDQLRTLVLDEDGIGGRVEDGIQKVSGAVLLTLDLRQPGQHLIEGLPQAAELGIGDPLGLQQPAEGLLGDGGHLPHHGIERGGHPPGQQGGHEECEDGHEYQQARKTLEVCHDHPREGRGDARGG